MPLSRPLSPGKNLIALLALLWAVTPALAGGAGGENIYADSFGNLIVHSPAGFKRIVVGQGHLADDLAYRGRNKPKVAYLEADRGELYLHSRKPCRYGALLHGRSHMYGLPDNVVPVLTVSCR